VWAVVRNLNSLVVLGVVAIGGLLASGSAQAQYLPPNRNPGPFPPRIEHRHGTYPYGPWGWNYGGWNYGGWNYGWGFGYGRFPGHGPGYHGGGHHGHHGSHGGGHGGRR
jgi:hypothetical protein